MDWTTISVIIGVLGGLISIIQGVLGILDRFQKRSAQAAAAYSPPADVARPGAVVPARPAPTTANAPAWPAQQIPARSAPAQTSPAQQPVYAPVPQPGYAPATVQTAAPPRTARRFGTHPWIALGAGAYFLLYAVGAAIGAFDATSPNQGVGIAIISIAALPFYAAWIASIVQAIRMRRWGWLVGVVLSIGLGAFVFGIVGPTERRVPAGRPADRLQR